MGVMLGGPSAQRTRVHGDLVTCYQYVNEERSLVIYPRHRRGVNAGAFIIGDSSIWKYVDDPAYMVSQCMKACEVMGFTVSKPTAMRIANLILDGAEDLIRMRPDKSADALRPKHEGILNVNGKQIEFEA